MMRVRERRPEQRIQAQDKAQKEWKLGWVKQDGGKIGHLLQKLLAEGRKLSDSIFHFNQMKDNTDPSAMQEKKQQIMANLFGARAPVSKRTGSDFPSEKLQKLQNSRLD